MQRRFFRTATPTAAARPLVELDPASLDQVAGGCSGPHGGWKAEALGPHGGWKVEPLGPHGGWKAELLGPHGGW